MLRTRFTEMFGLDYPVMSAPMTSHSGGTLAGAVSAAGGLGSFGAISESGPEWAREQLAIVRKKTDRPFAAGFITHFMHFAEPIFELVLAEGVPAVVFSFADPGPHARRARDAGARVICQVQTMASARQAIDAGAEVLIAQGNEAGGHTGERPLLPFLIEVCSTWPDTPVLAAGGIATGAALAAALAAGADGACLGTHFVATHEAIEVAEGYKQRIVNARAEDSVYTRVFDLLDVQAWGIPPWPDGIGARVLRNETVDQWQGREVALAAQIVTAAEEFTNRLQEDELRWRPIYAGPAAGAVQGIRAAGDIVRQVCEDAERVLRARAAEVLA